MRGLLGLIAAIAAGLMGLLALPAEARRVALVIGNADYRIGPLANPVNDAAAVAEAFERQLKFDKVIFRKNLGAEAFRAALRELSREAAGAELGVVYFAGHGTEVGGKNFLIPVDATLERPSALDLEAIQLDTVLRQLDGVRQLKLVILDACRNNVFLPSAKRSGQRGLARIEPESNTLVAYAAREGTAADDGAGRHSPYTAALLKHLATPGLEINLLFRRVRSDVMAATGGGQQPAEYHSLGDKEIFLVPPRSSTGVGVPTVPASDAALAWAAVKSTISIAALEEFRRKYGAADPVYDRLAEARIVELRRQQTALALPPMPPKAAGKTQKIYDEGASDTEIKIGNANPYSGPASAYGQIGKTIDAFFRMVNDQGGINGRRVLLISYDDGYSPAKTAEVVRRLVEEDKVLLVFQTLGTPPNMAIHKYLNAKKVPQLFVATGASVWGSPKVHPWTMGWQPSYATEGMIYARHILATIRDARIGVLMQNDDYGRDYLAGFKRGLGKDADKIVHVATYEVVDPTVDSQVIALKSSGANTFFSITTPKFAAQAIRKAREIGWRPVHYLNSVSAAIGSVLKPAGLDASQGIITVAYMKDATDPEFQRDADMTAWRAFMDKYHPQGDKTGTFGTYGYAVSSTLLEVLKRAGNTLTRENVMKQAASLKGLHVPLLLPGVTLNTSSTDFYPIQSVRLQRFEGQTWRLFGEVVSAEDQ